MHLAPKTISDFEELRECQFLIVFYFLISIFPPTPEMSISTTLAARICLVGEVGKDAETLQAAESFGLPIVTSETGLDILGESEWRTFYVLDDFEGASFEAIHKQKEW